MGKLEDEGMRRLCEEMRIVADEMKRWGGFLALVLLAFLAAPALGDEAAVGEGGGGYLPLGDGWETNTLSIEVPDIGNFPLIPGQNNVNSEAVYATITTEGAWTLSVSDQDKTVTNGKMTEYIIEGGAYVSPDPDKLGAAMLVKATGSYGSDTNQTLPTGGQIAQGGSALTDERIPITFTQPVSWDDQVSETGRGYKIVVTFTISPGS